MPTSSEWSLTFRFSNQNTVCISHPSSACYMPSPSHPPLFYHHNNIWGSTHAVKLLIMHSSLTLHHFFPGPNYLLSTLFSNILNLCSSFSVGDQVAHLYKKSYSFLYHYEHNFYQWLPAFPDPWTGKRAVVFLSSGNAVCIMSYSTNMPHKPDNYRTLEHVYV
jgi:hypothetical protein